MLTVIIKTDDLDNAVITTKITYDALIAQIEKNYQPQNQDAELIYNIQVSNNVVEFPMIQMSLSYLIKIIDRIEDLCKNQSIAIPIGNYPGGGVKSDNTKQDNEKKIMSINHKPPPHVD